MNDLARALKPEEYFIEDKPYYEAVGSEIDIFLADYKQQIPILLKGHTFCGAIK